MYAIITSFENHLLQSILSSTISQSVCQLSSKIICEHGALQTPLLTTTILFSITYHLLSICQCVYVFCKCNLVNYHADPPLLKCARVRKIHYQDVMVNLSAHAMQLSSVLRLHLLSLPLWPNCPGFFVIQLTGRVLISIKSLQPLWHVQQLLIWIMNPFGPRNVCTLCALFRLARPYTTATFATCGSCFCPLTQMGMAVYGFALLE